MIPTEIEPVEDRGGDPPIFRYRFHPCTETRKIDKAAKSRRTTVGIVPGKRRCHGRWYKGRGPVLDREGRRKFALRSGPYRGRPVTFQLFLLRPRGPFPATFPLRQPTRAHAGNALLCRWQPAEKCSCKFIFLDFFLFFFEEGRLSSPSCPNFSLQRRIFCNRYFFSNFSFFFGRKNVIIYWTNRDEFGVTN